MENLFNFEYSEQPLFNADGSKSNFRQVFGKNGVNTICPKSTYHIVKTADLSTLGNAFIEQGYKVNTFDHRNGEIIGLSVDFGDRPTKVGECNYKLHIKVPNNNGGKGYLSIKQVRLVCSNGMVRDTVLHKEQSIKIPHTIDYKHSIDLMRQSIESFTYLLNEVEQHDELLNGKPLTDTDAMYHLNKWFFEQEMPTNHKKDLDLDSFRKAVAMDPDSIKSIDRYNELKAAFKRELEYNDQLGLDLTMYTVYATVTNYISRRIEKSNSTAAKEIQDARSSAKLVYFENV